jgi:hypothetical protein
MTELKNRGIADVLVLCCDGLKGPLVTRCQHSTVLNALTMHYSDCLAAAN